MSVSPTVEGFRAAFRRPSLTFAEIAWRWAVGGTAWTLVFFGFFEYLDTLPVNNREALMLKTRQPYLVGEAISEIVRGSFGRLAVSALLAALLLSLLWIVAASLGRMATVRALLDYFRARIAGLSGVEPDREKSSGPERDGDIPLSPPATLLRLNFLRVAVAVASLTGFLGAFIVAGLASPSAHPRPGLAFLLFVPLAGFVCFAGWFLNWLLSLAAIFAVRDGCDVIGAISSAIDFSRERAGALSAVTAWYELGHFAILAVASTLILIPLGALEVLAWRLALLFIILGSLLYFALADWLYMVRLSGYVCVLEMPDALLHPAPPVLPRPPAAPPVQTAIDRDELILSDVPVLNASI